MEDVGTFRLQIRAMNHGPAPSLVLTSPHQLLASLPSLFSSLLRLPVAALRLVNSQFSPTQSARPQVPKHAPRWTTDDLKYLKHEAKVDRSPSPRPEERGQIRRQRKEGPRIASRRREQPGLDVADDRACFLRRLRLRSGWEPYMIRDMIRDLAAGVADGGALNRSMIREELVGKERGRRSMGGTRQ